MKFSVPQCIERIKSPANQGFIMLARKQEERLRMHVEAITSRERMPGAFTDFLNWVKTFLPADKYNRFNQLIKFPLETVGFTKSIFEELAKFNDAPDAFTRFDFTAPEYGRDFLQYMQTNLNDENFWEERGFRALKTAINSFLIVDLPTLQTGPRPEPYYYLASIDAVYDVEIRDRTGVLEYIIVRQSNGTLLFIDEIAYRIFAKHRTNPQTGETTDLPEWELVSEAVHSTYQRYLNGEAFIGWGPLVDGLGYVPACSFWEHSIADTAGIDKEGPITNNLGPLDKLLFKIISQDYFELYGSYPIVVKYKEPCRYRDEEKGECNNGFLSWYDTAGKPCKEECPACAKRSLIGAGSQLEIDPPLSGSDVDLLASDGVKFIEPSTDLLEFGVENIERKKKEVFVTTVGYYQEASKEAINQLQVKGQFESKEAILDTIREQVDASRLFVLETIARLRYGTAFIGGNVFGGREYFLRTAEDINDQYDKAKKSGLPSYVLERIRQTYIKTKFRNNPIQEQRMFILGELEPYPDFTTMELRNQGINLIDPVNYILKLNFLTLVKRFESENANIAQFGSLIDFDRKLATIRGVLEGYAKEILANAPPPPAPTLQPA